jgi:hypothetical protein
MERERPRLTSKGTRQEVYDQMQEFESQNPKVAEAMRLFGMSLAEYQGALNAMHGVRITQSTVTTQFPTQRETRG